MIISITGDPGSGKTTIANLLAQKLNYKHYSTGNYMRKMAQNYDMTFEEFNRYAEKNRKIDDELDSWQTEIGKKQDDFVIDARLAWHFIPKSIKVFFKCDSDVATKRIFLDTSEEREKEKKLSNIEDKKKQIKIRKASEKNRYKNLYNLNVYNLDNYDIVIDTTNLNIQQVLQKLLNQIKKYL
jgi:cytidylate kinase